MNEDRSAELTIQLLLTLQEIAPIVALLAFGLAIAVGVLEANIRALLFGAVAAAVTIITPDLLLSLAAPSGIPEHLQTSLELANDKDSITSWLSLLAFPAIALTVLGYFCIENWLDETSEEDEPNHLEDFLGTAADQQTAKQNDQVIVEFWETMQNMIREMRASDIDAKGAERLSRSVAKVMRLVGRDPDLIEVAAVKSFLNHQLPLLRKALENYRANLLGQLDHETRDRIAQAMAVATDQFDGIGELHQRDRELDLDVSISVFTDLARNSALPAARGASATS